MSALERIRKWCLAVLAVLAPMPGFGGSSVRDAMTFAKYNGTMILEADLRDILKEPIWRDGLKAAQAVASAARELRQKMESYEKKLREVCPEEPDHIELLMEVLRFLLQLHPPNFLWEGSH